MAGWSVQKLELDAPSLEDLISPISTGLSSNFQDSSVAVVSCPDLRQAPYNLAAPGLCGKPRIADVGGPANLAPSPKLDRKYSFIDMVRLMEMGHSGAVIGASAGPFHIVGVNSELMPNWSYEEDAVVNRTHYAKIDEEGGCLCERLNSEDFGLMANLFGSEGSPGRVLKITAKIRTGDDNFTSTIQKALKARFGDRVVSLGGVFVIKKGKANLHVMPDFSRTPLKSRDEVEKWLRYFDMSAPLVCLSVFHSHDPGLDLRMEHTHCFSDHNEGGHYHDDITPADVEYEAYFNVADVLYRIDRPEN
ncbi:Ester hydrolase-like protein [Lachnellula hyalina]|uniref:Ester hydrolase-like protein n=1 Tax=Lachnellula hyalina TaxID=1316788 RepID=A0A8H8RBE0_9HELO|nr:Ester hydrolase-like protein [Lachnellula hyalina]TVY30246.1 Ester hydrolase-like protein [Lachnellula hyalina]